MVLPEPGGEIGKYLALSFKSNEFFTVSCP